MMSSINTTALPVNALLRQQTERRAAQAEQQAQALENQAAAKRREARQADATAKKLDSEADQATAVSNLLRTNLTAADRVQQSTQDINERLKRATTTAIDTTEQAATPTNNLTREINNIVAGATNRNSGSTINVQV